MALAPDAGGGGYVPTPEEELAAYQAQQYAAGNTYSSGNGYPSEYAWGPAPGLGIDPAPGYGLPTVSETLNYYADAPGYTATPSYTNAPYEAAPIPPSYMPPAKTPSATSQTVQDWQSSMNGGTPPGYETNLGLFQRMSNGASDLIRESSDGTFRMFDQASAYALGQPFNPASMNNPGAPNIGAGGGGARGYIPAEPLSTTWGGMMASPAIYTGFDSQGNQLPVPPEATYPKNTRNVGGWAMTVPSWDETTPTQPIPTPSGVNGGDWSQIGVPLTAIQTNERQFGKDSNRYDNFPGRYSFPEYNPLPVNQEPDRRMGPPGAVPIPPGGVPIVPIGPPIPPILPPPGIPIPPGGVPPIPIGPPIPPGRQEAAPSPTPYTFPKYNPIPPAGGQPPAAQPQPSAPAPAAPAPAASAAPTGQETPLITPDGTVYGVLTTNANGQTVVRKVPKNKPNRWNIPQLENTGIRQGVVGMLQGSNVGPNLPPGITQTVPPGFALPPGFLLPKWAEQNPLPPTFQETVRRQNQQQMNGREPNRNKLRRR